MPAGKNNAGVNRRPIIALAGASGYIGKAFWNRNYGKYNLRAIGRSLKSFDSREGEIVKADLYSMLQAERALEGVHTAVYLVHSMMPSARLNQGSFADTDLILADNFARSAKKAKVKHIIYVGGIIPPGTSELSLHLASRLEVERVLAGTGIPVTVLRAGLIIGQGGSSYIMVEKLVRRLPVMLCPSWTSSLSEPVSLDDLIDSIEFAIQKPNKSKGDENRKVLNVVGPDRLSYIQLMRMMARVLGRKRAFISVPLFSPGLSVLWVRLFTGSSRELVKPLVQSLKHDMIADTDRYEGTVRLYDAMAGAVSKRLKKPADTARSIQRISLPPGTHAEFLAEIYPVWLSRKLRPVLKVKKDGHVYSICWRFPEIELLQLTRSAERSGYDRQLLYVTGGILSREKTRGRLEFRTVLDGRYALAALHDFVPALPWYIYSWTQAKVHLWVMNAFGRYIASQTSTDG